MVDFGKNDIMPHFIYCYGYFVYTNEEFKKLKEIILKIYQLENQLFDLCYGRLTHEEGPGLINYRIACDL